MHKIIDISIYLLILMLVIVCIRIKNPSKEKEIILWLAPLEIVYEWKYSIKYKTGGKKRDRIN